MRRERGFTLIELLIVIAIIGILAAVAIPNLLTALNRARQKRSMADIRTIATGWESRATDTGKYNAAAAGMMGASSPVLMTDLALTLSPTYVKKLPTSDGWNNPFQCFVDIPMAGALPATKYVIASMGRDGSLGSGASGVFPTTNFDCDIVFSNGVFLSYPEGIQSQ